MSDDDEFEPTLRADQLSILQRGVDVGFFTKVEVGVELDIVHDDVPLGPPSSWAMDRAIEELTKNTALTARVVTNEGPTGWPVVEFTGTAGDVAILLERYFEDPDNR